MRHVWERNAGGLRLPRATDAAVAAAFAAAGAAGYSAREVIQMIDAQPAGAVDVVAVLARMTAARAVRPTETPGAAAGMPATAGTPTAAAGTAPAVDVEAAGALAAAATAALDAESEDAQKERVKKIKEQFNVVIKRGGRYYVGQDASCALHPIECKNLIHVANRSYAHTHVWVKDAPDTYSAEYECYWLDEEQDWRVSRAAAKNVWMTMQDSSLSQRGTEVKFGVIKSRRNWLNAWAVMGSIVPPESTHLWWFGNDLPQNERNTARLIKWANGAQSAMRALPPEVAINTFGRCPTVYSRYENITTLGQRSAVNPKAIPSADGMGYAVEMRAFNVNPDRAAYAWDQMRLIGATVRRVLALDECAIITPIINSIARDMVQGLVRIAEGGGGLSIAENKSPDDVRAANAAAAECMGDIWQSLFGGRGA
jgi:hypothetical protein